MSDIKNLLEQAEKGFQTLSVSAKFHEQALRFLKEWLTKNEFVSYVPQIEHLIKYKYWDYLLDSFYQIIPFGTGGRRGEVGIGPNRINPWTIKSSAQGHSQYLTKHFNSEDLKRGVVLAYDVREFFSNKYFNDDIPNPVKNLTCRDLAYEAAKVYVANGIKVYIFDNFRSTPELSFAIRFLNAIGGDVFSASHNPPEHNGKKVYDQFGGQLVPPDDEKLVFEVTKHLKEIQELDLEAAKQQGLIETIGEAVDEAYYQAASKVTFSSHRDLKIVYTPLHGCGITSVLPTLKTAGFSVLTDPKTDYPSGKFENVTFNIPNPEVEQSFETSLQYAKQVNADIILSSDPDADRLGIMVHHQGEWLFLNGNEIGAILSEYMVSKIPLKERKNQMIIKTLVTTNLITEICKQNKVQMIGDLMVGFKYVGEEMNKLEKRPNIHFLLGTEESHGYLVGDYSRDKDAASSALLLAEIAAWLSKDDLTLVDYLRQIYAKYGYFRNYLTEIRLPGAEGKSQIDKIQDVLRDTPPTSFSQFKVEKIDDFQTHLPIVSETDKSSKNMLVFHIAPLSGTTSIQITVRPSGTEPKIKMYFEIGSLPFDIDRFEIIRAQMEIIRNDLEKEFMKMCYKIIGIDFPDRGFLLFWQLPLQLKLKYFEIEDDLAALRKEENAELRQQKLDERLKFLGSNPVEKVDKAFQAKYKSPILEYLKLQ